MGEVLDRGAFAQEFRIRANGEIRIRPELLQAPLDLAAGADGNGRFRRDDGEAGKMRRDLLKRLIHVGEVRIAVAPAHRRSDRQENEIGLARGRRKLPREMKPARPHVLRHQIVEAGLVDRNFAAAELRKLSRILFDASDVPAEIRKAGGGYQADIAGTDHANVHALRPSNGIWASLRPPGGGQQAWAARPSAAQPFQRRAQIRVNSRRDVGTSMATFPCSRSASSLLPSS